MFVENTDLHSIIAGKVKDTVQLLLQITCAYQHDNVLSHPLNLGDHV